MPPASETLARTALHARHRGLGAKLVPFAGWEMPVEYEGIRPEHRTVRSTAGLFDVSHMGQVETRGPEAERLLQRVLSNDVARLAEGRAQYSVMCRPDAGVLDDLFTYRLGPDRYLTVTNAANHVRDRAWIAEHAGDLDVEVRDVADEHAMLALQGPDARAILDRHVEGETPGRMRVAEARVAGVDCLVCGTGYTGEDGVELLCPPDGAEALWDALTGDGATPVGLGARDTLRLEVCFHLYGNDLSEDRDPLSAGLDWVCKLETGFIGADVLKGFEPTERLVPFELTDRGIPRPGNPVLVDGAPAGVVTSGTLSPSLDRGIGMAYVPVAVAEPGTAIEIDVRGRHRPAEIREKPLYRKEA